MRTFTGLWRNTGINMETTTNKQLFTTLVSNLIDLLKWLFGRNPDLGDNKKRSTTAIVAKVATTNATSSATSAAPTKQKQKQQQLSGDSKQMFDLNDDEWSVAAVFSPRIYFTKANTWWSLFNKNSNPGQSRQRWKHARTHVKITNKFNCFY